MARDPYDDAVTAIMACIGVNGDRVTTSTSAIGEILRSRFVAKELTAPARAKGFAKTPPVIHLPVNYDWPHDRLRRAEAEIATLRRLLADAQSSNSGRSRSTSGDT
jgi:hypothetical protein